MTAEEALAAAEAEGLPLVVNARDHKNGLVGAYKITKTAYKHVSWGQGAYNLAKKVATPDGNASKHQFIGCVYIPL